MMAEKKFISKTGKSPRLFDNPVLEALTRCHPSVPFIIFTPVVLFFLYRAIVINETPLWLIPVICLSALIFWSSLEYFIHRYILHFKPTSQFGKKLVYAAHGVHHDYPNDKTRLVLPPSITIPGAFMFYGIFYLILGPNYVDAFSAGLVACYLFYDFNHFAAHNLNINNPFSRKMKKHHLKHHFKDATKGYGFTTST